MGDRPSHLASEVDRAPTESVGGRSQSRPFHQKIQFLDPGGKSGDGLGPIGATPARALGCLVQIARGQRPAPAHLLI